MYVNKSIQTDWHFKKNKLISHLPNMEKNLNVKFNNNIVLASFQKYCIDLQKNIFLLFMAVFYSHTLRQQIQPKGTCNIIQTFKCLLYSVKKYAVIFKCPAKLYSKIIRCRFDIISRVCHATSCKLKTVEFVSLMP